MLDPDTDTDGHVIGCVRGHPEIEYCRDSEGMTLPYSDDLGPDKSVTPEMESSIRAMRSK